jgi:hypothetical protein
MAKAKTPQTPRAKLEAALAKHSDQTLVDGINEAGSDDLRLKLENLAKYENETEKALKEDEGIVEMTDDLKEAKAPYKGTLKGIKLQRNLIGLRLLEVGSTS